ncbi:MULTISPECIES: permease [unclassified Meridianimarinicoccus]|uniref:permease n=1 Tax=unclassified Meridianimarinicoccus TaxID=2923344 RepID=UPI001866F152|nr:permease [Fluviibacterium sp. MJW13]
MTDLSTAPRPLPALWRRLDKVLLAFAVVFAAVAVLDAAALGGIAASTVSSLAHTAPYIAFAVLAVAYLKATGAEHLVAAAFHGRELRMIFLAALMGGLSPFCSCEIIPFIAGLLALGAPLSAVMALWLASPLMDPAMFAITAGAIGLDFAIAKTVVAVSLGILGGLTVMVFARSPVFVDPLRTRPARTGCCSSHAPVDDKPVWKFWGDPARRATFGTTVRDNSIFLLKWLALAYLLESLMLRYVPADLIAQVLGGQGAGPILLGALVGAPAYLNGYAAVPLVGGLLEQGMSPGAAMSFVVAGGVSCIPAAVAVWALVKPRVFAAYAVLGLSGAVAAGFAWAAIA